MVEKNGQRVYRWTKTSYISQRENFKKYKIYISKADGAAGQIGKPIPARIMGKPTICYPNEAYTDTFISMGCFTTEYEANSLVINTFNEVCKNSIRRSESNANEYS